VDIKQIITDYIMKSILTAQGDLVVRGAAVPEALADVAVGQVLKSGGVGEIPAWGVDRAELTTEGDLTVRGAAVAEKLAAVAVGQVLKSQGVGAKPAWGAPLFPAAGMAIGEFFRDSDGTSGISGLGFEPRLFFFFCVDNTPAALNMCWGFDDVSNHYCIYLREDGSYSRFQNSNSIYIYESVGNLMTGVVSATDSDGFDITFTLTGTRALNGIYLAIG